MENIINLTKMSFNNLTSIFKNTGIVLLIWLVIAIINPSFLSMLFAMGGYLLLYQIMAYEDMYKIDNLISSLPVKKSEYIISRYVLGITISVISIIFLTIFYLITNMINSNNIPLDIYILIGVISSVISISSIIPIVIKFGVTKGRLIVLIIFMLIVGLPMGIVGILGEEPQILKLALSMVDRFGLPLIVLLLSFVILLISITISLKLYNKKELI